MRKLPASYKKYFWDSDFNRLNLTEHKTYILSRLLAYGDFEAIKFILHNFPKKSVKMFLDKKGNTALSKASFLFWQKLIKYDELWKK